MDVRQHPLEVPEPLVESIPPPLPDHVRRALEGSEAPCLVYDLAQFRRDVRDVLTAFPEYRFPIKCNAFEPVVRAVLGEGAGLDACSPQELSLALALGAHGDCLSYTGVALGLSVMEQLFATGAVVNLDSSQEVQQWLDAFSGAPVGFRLKAGTDRRYRHKFGIGETEIPSLLDKVQRSGSKLRSLHVHFNHPSRTAQDFAHEYNFLVDQVRGHLGDWLAEVEYLSLGGGWPLSYSSDERVLPTELADALFCGPLASLTDVGFRGKVIVEPGEYVVAKCGYWAARVVTIKEGVDGLKVAILDTVTPIPSAALPYPVIVLRELGHRLTEMRHGDARRYTLVGATNSPFDTIRKSVLLPTLRCGDLIVLCKTGAYLHSLLGGFNSRPAPMELAVDVD